MNLKLLSDRVSEAGITQAELAKRAGISAASMSRKCVARRSLTQKRQRQFVKFSESWTAP